MPAAAMPLAAPLAASFGERLAERRRRLTAALATAGRAALLESLLAEVDAALARLEDGSYGLCVACGDAVEVDRLAADPLLRFCLDHLSAAERRAFEHDLDTAARIQRALVPPSDLAHAGWLLRFEYRPAGPVSGDFLVLPAPVVTEPPTPRPLDLAFGDAAGKGVAGSLLVSQLHAIFRGLFAAGAPLAALMSDANRIFCESTPANAFATAVAARLSPDGAAEIANAGHPPALLRAADGTVRRLDSGGLPLGLFARGEYAARRLSLAAGETLLLYTDGFSEATDPAGREHGVDRLAERFATLGGAPPEESAAALVDHLAAFRAGGLARDVKAHDDLALLVVRRTA